MLIETDEWVKLSDAGKALGIQQSVAYRTAHRLGITKKVFGLFIVRKDDVQKIADGKLSPGWQWISDPSRASQDAKKGVEASLKARGLKRRPPRQPPPTLPPGVKRRGRPRKIPAATSPRTSRGTSGTATAGRKAE